MIHDGAGWTKKGGEYGTTRTTICGAPHPLDPSWHCTRPVDHPRDFHKISLFSGDVTWRIDRACNGD